MTKRVIHTGEGLTGSKTSLLVTEDKAVAGVTDKAVASVSVNTQEILNYS